MIVYCVPPVEISYFEQSLIGIHENGFSIRLRLLLDFYFFNNARKTLELDTCIHSDTI